ncbi:hypothetical protein AB1Y20_022299 [Prymnesium parvum]|uniref:beta-galactosidase n=1 Tax=Prymnesium parvum TaxID=97485 RepID=A0AB34JFX9_PRYPA
MDEWADPSRVGEGRRPMHTPLHAYESAAQALATGVVDRALHSPSRWRLPLSPAAWRFHFAPCLDAAPALVPGRGFAPAAWTQLEVPLSWELAGHGAPQYTNVRYPPPLDVWRAPHVGRANPVGSYERSFVVPEEWEGRRVVLQLDGVSCAATVFVDGLRVGYSQDSKLPAEFDITRALEGGGGGRVAGEHCVSVRVMKWSDGSYLEDQDQWWLSGIQRHVCVYSKPRHLAIANYAYSFDGEAVRVRAACEGDAKPSELHEYALFASLHGPALLTPAEPPPRRAMVWRVPLPLAASETAQPPEAPAAARGLMGSFAFEASAEVAMDAPALWTAETPHLYTLLLELRRRRSGGGGACECDGWCEACSEAVDVEACFAGLRTVTISDGLLRLNGTPLTLCGVNRHEHCPRGGKAVGWGTMLTDARLIKQHSFNAVRCSHYPNDSRWYELCDALGLYLVDEANIETHGFAYTGDEGALAKRPAWAHAFMERLARMVQRDHNHPSVLIWSLGNEAGYGPTHDAMAAWCRAHEPSRPVQYESCGGNACTDIVCPMYPSERTLRLLATRAGQCASSFACGQPEPTRAFPAARHASVRPLVPCEYAHGMGNSTGNLREWWELFDELPACQGGFMWDWVDQGLGEAGDWRYGGDFGEAMHDARFCLNGLVFPDRTPHPGLLEAKAAMAPLSLSLASFAWADGAALVGVRLASRYAFVDTAHLLAAFTLLVDGEPIGEANLRLDGRATVPPRGEVRLDLRLALRPPRPSCHSLHPPSLYLRADFSLARRMAWADEGHSVALVQCAIPHPLPPSLAPPPPPPPAAPLPASSFEESEHAFELAAARVSLRLCRRTAELSLRLDGEALLEGGSLSLWRAPTDNDEGCALNALCHPRRDSIAQMVWWLRVGVSFAAAAPPWLLSAAWSTASLWRRDGLDALSRRLVSASSPSACRLDCVVDYTAPSGARRATHTLRLSLLPCGALVAASEATVLSSADCLPRVGLAFTLPAPLARAAWLGDGPHENYPDRRLAAVHGRHEASADELYTPYIFPSENGARAAAWVALHSARAGVWVGAARPAAFSFSAQRYSAAQLAAAAHQADLTPAEGTHVHVDAAICGVGGDTGWSPSVRAPYRVPPGTYRWVIVLRPFGAEEELRAAPQLPERWERDLCPWGEGAPAYAPLRWRQRAAVRLAAFRALASPLLAALLVVLIALAVRGLRGVTG